MDTVFAALPGSRAGITKQGPEQDVMSIIFSMSQCSQSAGDMSPAAMATSMLPIEIIWAA